SPSIPLIRGALSRSRPEDTENPSLRLLRSSSGCRATSHHVQCCTSHRTNSKLLISFLEHHALRGCSGFVTFGASIAFMKGGEWPGNERGTKRRPLRRGGV